MKNYWIDRMPSRRGNQIVAFYAFLFWFLANPVHRTGRRNAVAGFYRRNWQMITQSFYPYTGSEGKQCKPIVAHLSRLYRVAHHHEGDEIDRIMLGLAIYSDLSKISGARVAELRTTFIDFLGLKEVDFLNVGEVRQLDDRLYEVVVLTTSPGWLVSSFAGRSRDPNPVAKQETYAGHETFMRPWTGER